MVTKYNKKNGKKTGQIHSTASNIQHLLGHHFSLDIKKKKRI